MIFPPGEPHPIELNDSEQALSRADPLRPIDWITPSR
jgi:hypothetical protein